MKRIPPHPFLFAAFFILAVYAANIGEVPRSDLVLTLLIASGSVLALSIVAGLVLKDRNKAGMIVSVFVVLFFSYGHIIGVLRWHLPEIQRLILPLWAILFLLASCLIVRIRWNMQKLTLVLSVMGVCMLIIPLILIGTYETKRIGSSAEQQAPVMSLELDRPDSPPDIYYIILDAYPSSDQLMEAYDYDNRGFENFLIDRGFYVAAESASNYCWTRLSLPSSLNMDYLDTLISQATLVSQERDARLLELVQDNRVVNALKHVDYRYVHFNTNWNLTASSTHADLAVDISGTSLTPFQSMLIFGDTVGQREHVLKAFDELAEIPAIEGPKFVFAHIMCPHHPFIFDSDGSPIEPTNVPSKEKVSTQITFLNNKVEVMVDQILSGSTTPPIIIIQGDHGIRSSWLNGTIDYDNPTEADVRDHHMILNAVYLPHGGDSLMYESISPVNIFRAVFNFYFGADLPFLPDESYLSALGSQSLVNVTDKLR